MIRHGFVKALTARVSTPQARRAGLVFVIGFALALLSACGGERPELVDDGTSSTVLADSSTTLAVTESTVDPLGSSVTVADQAADESATAPLDPSQLEITQCLTVVGPGPWPIAIGPNAKPDHPCGRAAAHHRVEFENNTGTQVSFDFAGQPVAIEPGSKFVSEPIGTLAEPGVVPIDVGPVEVTLPWLVPSSADPLESFQVLLGKFGPIEVGMSVAEAEVAIDGNDLKRDENEDCYVSYVLGDPYSPLLTVRNDTITAVQVFTPGQQTRSGIGVGSSEADVQTAYGDNIVTEAAATDNPAQKLMVFVPTDEADKANRIVFAVDNGVVTSLRTGVTESIVSGPGCSTP